MSKYVLDKEEINHIIKSIEKITDTLRDGLKSKDETHLMMCYNAAFFIIDQIEVFGRIKKLCELTGKVISDELPTKYAHPIYIDKSENSKSENPLNEFLKELLEKIKDDTKH